MDLGQICIGRPGPRSPKEGYHLPFALDAFLAPLPLPPLLCAPRCDAEVDEHEDEGAEHGRVDPLAVGGGDEHPAKVHQALEQVVGRDEVGEGRVLRLLVVRAEREGGEVGVGVVLHAGGDEDDGQEPDHGVRGFGEVRDEAGGREGEEEVGDGFGRHGR